MRHARPPLIAAWMLEQFSARRLDEALVGDLFEEFHSGRSAGWFWRQVLSAITAGLREEIACHRALLFFALLWSAIAPAWLDITAPGNFPEIAESIRHIDWPWSSICSVGLFLGPSLAFIWVGIFAYLFLAFRIKPGVPLREIQTGLLRSLSAFAPFWIGTCAMTLLLRASSLHFIDWQSFMPAVTALAVRLPFFATILWALWGSTPTRSSNGVSVS
jgi:hypothetical protein